MFTVYTDGACSGNPGPGGWGAVVYDERGERREISGRDPNTTNNRMEITAVLRGLDATPVGAQVLVRSDSEYVIKTMTKGWQRKANQDLWALLDAAVRTRRVSWEWVKGHNGDPDQERADALAVAAANGRPAPLLRAAAIPPEQTQPADAGSKGSGASLTHLDERGRARMVDVGAKPDTVREATAKAFVRMNPETLRLVQEGGMPKGDVLATARLAGIMAAKRTSELIPLCHPLPLTSVTVDLEPDPAASGIAVTATARTVGKTGVEMEALTAASVAALTVYDMCKAVQRDMRITDVRLVRKTGGRSGDVNLE